MLPVVLGVLVGCGKKGPPLAPFIDLPARVDDVEIRRLGQEVYLQFTLPTRNDNGRIPADLDRIEVYGFTGDPVNELGTPLDDEEFVEFGTLVASVHVQPPPPEVEEGEAEPASLPPLVGPPDPRPVQGERVTVVETLTPDAFVAVEVDTGVEVPDPPDVLPPRIVPPEVVLKLDQVARRRYVTLGRTFGGSLGPASNRIPVPLEPAPPNPSAPAVHYSPTLIDLAWVPPPDPPDWIQQPPTPEVLKSVAIFEQRSPYRYNVYEVPASPRRFVDRAPSPLNTNPQLELSYQDDRVTFGARRCYAVRTVLSLGPLEIESEPSPRTCVTLVDRFAPAAPLGLAAVGSAGAVSLIWEAVSENDLAGYLVLRAEAPDETLQAITSTPIRETTYRDTDVQSGVRYQYAVVAVDAARPPNVSVPSNRVVESPR